jgi:hypothetical protein
MKPVPISRLPQASCILLLLLPFLSSCSKGAGAPAVRSTKVVLIDDLTDSFQLRPAPDPILSLYGFGKHKEQEAALDYVIINDRLLNATESIHLKSGAESEKDNMTDDVHYRDHLIQSFYAAVRKAFRDDPVRFTTERNIDQSRVFCTISSQLRRLASSHYQQKIMVVFSDLQENTSVFNAYAPESRRLLQQDPERVGSMLSRECGVPNRLEGITIYFCYWPRNRAEDERFMDMLSVYQLMLEKRGARIFFQAASDNYCQHHE